MSKQRRILLLLNDIIDSIVTIEGYLQGITEDVFYNDRKTKDAVVRNFEIIGEASRRIENNFKIQYPDVPWRERGDLRNKIIHEYFGIDYVVLWEIVQLNLPVVKKKVEALIANILAK
jgi:uncharacterized protein with HEPN domain